MQHEMMMILTIEMSEAAFGISEADSLPDHIIGDAGDTGAVVLHFEYEVCIRPASTQRNMGRNGRTGIAMLERVLHQRL